MQFDPIQQNLLNGWQRDFPLEPRPYARMAEQLGMTEDDVIAMLGDLLERGAISRIGAVVRPGSIGASTLAAMCVPEGALEDVAAMVSAHREVNHNYEREHRLNLWFVVAACDAQALDQVICAIESETDLEVLSLPLLEAFHIDLGFDLQFETLAGEGAA